VAAREPQAAKTARSIDISLPGGVRVTVRGPIEGKLCSGSTPGRRLTAQSLPQQLKRHERRTALVPLT